MSSRNELNIDNLANKAAIASTSNKLVLLESQNDFINKEKLRVEAELTKLKADNSTKLLLQNQIIVLKEQKNKLRLKLKDYEDVVKTSISQMDRHEQKRMKDLKLCDNEYQKQQDKVVELSQKVQDLTDFVEELESDKSKLYHEIETLQRAIEAYKTSRGEIELLMKRYSDSEVALIREQKELQSQLKMKEIEVLESQSYIKTLQSRIKDLEAKDNVSVKSFSELRHKIDTLGLDLIDRDNTIMTLQMKLKNREDEISRLQITVSEYRNQISQTTNSKEILKRNTKEKDANLKNLSSELDRSELMLKNAIQNTEFLQTEIDSHKATISTLYTDLDEERDTSREVKGQLNRMISENEILKFESTKLRNNIISLEAMITEIKKKNEDLRNENYELTGASVTLRDVTEKYYKLQDRILVLEKEKIEFSEERSTHEIQEINYQNELSKYKDRIESLNKENTSIYSQLEECRSKLVDSNKEIAYLTSQNKELDSLKKNLEIVREQCSDQMKYVIELKEQRDAFELKASSNTHAYQELHLAWTALTSTEANLRLIISRLNVELMQARTKESELYSKVCYLENSNAQNNQDRECILYI